VPGCTVYLEKGTNPGRKTAYDLIAVEKGNILINMDAQAPNKVFAEWAGAGNFLPDVTASDNGKFLRVSNGAWTAVTITNANGGSF